MNKEEFIKAYAAHPYDHCIHCPLNHENDPEQSCRVGDKYQRLPRDKYRGALGMCMWIGGRGN